MNTQFEPSDFRRIFLALLIAIFVAAPALAAECTLTVPGDYATITEALADANNCDRIVVTAGTYSTQSGESFPLRLQRPITLKNENGAQPIILGDREHTVVLIESGGVTLQGFHITGGTGSQGINNMDGGGVCIFVGPSETRPVTIENCVIEDNNCPSDETYDGCGGGIYCGGTYCTCFEINISNCIIRRNLIRGQGGGVFCALLSNVNIEDTTIEQNIADDHGGGVFVDMFASLLMANTNVVLNDCPGDPLKPDWGGKGGGLACESFGLFSAADCVFTQNTARYFGGGIFTRGGLFETEDLCGGSMRFPDISNSLIEKNHANDSGGGVYVAGSGVLEFANTTLYWNDAGHDGGAVFVAGGAMVGGEVYFTDGCLLEGNESADKAGGVYLGQYAQGTFESTRFLGNSSLFDGGAVFLEDGAAGELTDCLISYNNSARGCAGGIRATEQSYVNLVHCSLVGNFAPRERSGLYLDPNTTADIRDSILWRNAGGSIEANGATVDITCSLNEDGEDPNQGVICCEPKYVGWGSLEEVYVDASAAGPGTGTSDAPYPDLQAALDGFDFQLAADSPCLGSACDGGNIGAETGVGGQAGNIAIPLNLADGTYDIRGRNIIFTRGVQGAGSEQSVIRHAVLSYVEDAYIKELGITDEEIFGGITIRADVNFADCNVYENTALADGGGVYIADGNCVMTESIVSGNACYGNGGGYYAYNDTINNVTESTIAGNSSSGRGAGMFLSADSVLSLTSSLVSTNAAGDGGGGVCTVGQLAIEDVNFTGNSANYGGGVKIEQTGDSRILSSSFSDNRTGTRGGAIYGLGKMEIHDVNFVSNVSDFGGAIYIREEPMGPSICTDSQFNKNRANDWAGALYFYRDTGPQFSDCNFVENTAVYRGGAVVCIDRCQALFDRCNFERNTGDTGGSLYMALSKTRIRECLFTESSAKSNGGVAHLHGTKNFPEKSFFEKCRVEGSTAGSDGGAFYITDTAEPVFSNIEIAESTAVNYGGAIAVFKNAEPMFFNTSVSNSQAKYGGGVYACGDSQSNFQQCEFRNNHAFDLTFSADGGGAYFTQNAGGWFTRCAFHDNQAQDDGGGIAAAEQATVDLHNTLFAENTAVNAGGGVHFTFESVGTLTNCTIVSNTATHSNGGGIYLEATNTVNVDSSIICLNSPDGIRQGSNPSVCYCCVQEDWPGQGNLLCDDCCMLDPVTFELPEGSPCIDAGNPDPNSNDACRPPGKGEPRNDVGITGGPYNCISAPDNEFDFVTFRDWDFLVLRGDAIITDGILRLTEAQQNKVGGVWYPLPVYVQEGFDTTFDFQIDRDERDGFAFAIQNSSLTALGNNGLWMGYNIPNSIAIEFDTWRNSGYGDTNDNHISVQTRGILTNSPDHKYSLGWSDSIPLLSDNESHTAKIIYTHQTHGILNVFVDDMQSPALIVEVNLGDVLSLMDGQAFVGFTASTGGASETHDILRWSFTSTAASQ